MNHDRYLPGQVRFIVVTNKVIKTNVNSVVMDFSYQFQVYQDILPTNQDFSYTSTQEQVYPAPHNTY